MATTNTEASNKRKEKRHTWWKQHRIQVEGEGEDPPPKSSPPTSKSSKKFKKPTAVTPKESEKDLAEIDSVDGKRYILFIGNLPFDLKKEDILKHFSCTGGAADLRLMTKKDTGTSKGCGFLECKNSISYTKALNLHHSTLGGRKINVEVTCGGGGSSNKRKGKLKEKKDNFQKKRARKLQGKTSDAPSSNPKGKKTKEKIAGDDINSENQKRKHKHATENAEELVSPKKKAKLQDDSAMVSIVNELQLGEMVEKKQKTQADEVAKKEKKKKKKNKDHTVE